MQTDELTTQLLRNNEPLPIPTQNLRAKVWFFEREDGQGEVIAVEEAGAWAILRPSPNSRQPRYRLIGVSFGEPYATVVEKEIPKLKDPEEKKAALRKAFSETVEAARGHIEYPRNPNKLDINGQFITDPRVRMIIDGRE